MEFPHTSARKRNTTLRAGLLFGAILAAVVIVDTIIQTATGFFIFPGDFFSTAFALTDFQLGGVAGVASCVAIVAFLAISFGAGRRAARQTGNVGSGAVAGLIAGPLGTLIGYLVGATIAGLLLIPNQAQQVGGAATQPQDTAAVFIDIFFAILVLFAPYYAGLGAGFGALGGTLGARAYRRAHPNAETPQALGAQPPFALPLPAVTGMTSQEAERAIAHPALRYGLIFGAILSVSLIVGLVIQELAGAFSSPQDVFLTAFELIGALSAGTIIYLELLCLVILTCAAGILAARRSGKLGSGVLAGLFAGALGSVVGYAIGGAVIPWLLPLIAPLPQQQAFQGEDIGVLLGAVAFGASYVVSIWATLGGAIGLIGGLIGARSIRKPSAAAPPAAPDDPTFLGAPPLAQP